MATTVTSSAFGDFKAYMTYTTSSTNTAYTVKVSAAGVYQSCSWSQYPWYTKISATSHSDTSGSKSTVSWSKGYHSLTSKTCSWTRKTSAYSVTVKVYSKKNISGGGSGSKSVSFTVPALTKYTITYNANGGSGAPGATYKYYGQSAALSGTKPTRTGYKFLGWSTSSTATSATWAAGGSYTTNASNTLYAVWQANTYTITLDVNGGTNGSVTSVTKTYDKAVTLPTSAQSPTRKYYKFLGWSTSSTATSATWAAGASYSTNITADTTIYAVWKEDYIPPKITNLTAKRVSNSTGSTEDDEGVYGVVSFKWTAGTLSGAAQSSTITVQCAPIGSTALKTVYSTTSTSASGTITTGGFRYDDTDLELDTQYNINVTVADTNGNISDSTFISKAEFVIDINDTGKGLAIGIASSGDGFEVGWNTRLKKNVYIGNKIGLMDGNTGVLVNSGGAIYMQGVDPVIYFFHNAETTPAGMIRSNSDTRRMEFSSTNAYEFNNNIVLPTNKYIYGTRTDGTEMNIIGLNKNNNLLIGWDLYENASGNTAIYGDDVYIYSAAGGGHLKPYFCAGDSVSIFTYTTGYVSSSKQNIYFNIPFNRPVIGSPTVSSSSNDGLMLRQQGSYTHGSSSSTYVKPSSYTTTMRNGFITVIAKFNTTTNAVNNETIGIIWSATITFS